MGRVGCPSCGGPLAVDWRRGEVVCTQCGLVVDDVADTGPEWRAYDASQLARIRAAPPEACGQDRDGRKGGA